VLCCIMPLYYYYLRVAKLCGAWIQQVAPFLLEPQDCSAIKLVRHLRRYYRKFLDKTERSFTPKRLVKV
jgi:hypothetical protein